MLQEGDVVTVQPTDGAEFDATVVAVGRNDVVLSHEWTGGRGRRFATARYCASTSS